MNNEKYTVLLAIANPSGYGSGMLPSIEITGITLNTTTASFMFAHGKSVDFKYSDLVDALHCGVMGNNVVLTYQPSSAAYNGQVNRPMGYAPTTNQRQRIESYVVPLSFSPMTLQLVEPLRAVANGLQYKPGETTNDRAGWIDFKQPFSLHTLSEFVNHGNHGHRHQQPMIQIRAYRRTETGQFEFEHNNGTDIMSLQYIKEIIVRHPGRHYFAEEHRALLEEIMGHEPSPHTGEVHVFREPLLISKEAHRIKVMGYSTENDTVIMDTLCRMHGLDDVAYRIVTTSKIIREKLEGDIFFMDKEHEDFIYNVIGYKDPLKLTPLNNPMTISFINGEVHTILGMLETDDGLVLAVRRPGGHVARQICIKDAATAVTVFGNTPFMDDMDDSQEHALIYRTMFERDPVPVAQQFITLSNGEFPTSLTIQVGGEQHRLRNYRLFREGLMVTTLSQKRLFFRIGDKDDVGFVSATQTLLKQHPDTVECFKQHLAELKNK